MSMQLKITFESDWHIGEGAGASGHIDRVVRRHAEDNLPYVPAKTLTGILRDACEKVAFGLDDGNESGKWQQFVATLFGEQSKGADNIATTTPALVRIGPARFDLSLRRALQDRPELASALTFVKPGAALDENGVAKSQMLRFEEVVLAGAELSASIELDEKVGAGGTAKDAAIALLTAGATVVERLGAKRRRGNGRCAMELQSGTAPDFAKVFDGEPPKLSISTENHLALSACNPLKGNNGWHVLNLDLELLAPVAIPADTAGNVIATHDHIPGSLLLPALDKKLRQWLGAKSGELTAHLAADRIQIRNAYPVKDGQRLLPVPAALMAEKEMPSAIINEIYGHPNDDKQRKQLRTGYLPASGLPKAGDKSPVATVKVIATTHAVIEDRRQRPTEEVGGVYTYEAIAPGQRFRAEIRIAKSVLSELPDTQCLNGNLRIGRAKKDDYGLVSATVATGAAAELKNPVTQFTLWLTAPLLIRDERLRPIVTGDGFVKWLKGRDGFKNIESAGSFVRSVRIDGWNNAWKEPRPTRFGLAAGSCFMFKSTKDIDATALTKLQSEGLGERRGEGYGEVIVDAPLLVGTEPPDIPVEGKRANPYVVPDRKPRPSPDSKGFHDDSRDEDLIADAANHRESTEIRAWQRQTVEIFVQERCVEAAGEISSVCF